MGSESSHGANSGQDPDTCWYTAGLGWNRRFRRSCVLDEVESGDRDRDFRQHWGSQYQGIMGVSTVPRLRPLLQLYTAGMSICGGYLEVLSFSDCCLFNASRIGHRLLLLYIYHHRWQIRIDDLRMSERRQRPYAMTADCLTDADFSVTPGPQMERDVEQSQRDSKWTDLDLANLKAAQRCKGKVDKNRHLKKQSSAEGKAALKTSKSFVIGTQSVISPDRSVVKS